MALYSRFVIVLLLGVFGHTTQSAGTQHQASCNSPKVTEGQPTNMTFFFGRDIDTNSEGFFAYLRRDTDKVTDILRCDRPNLVMPVSCKATDKRFGDGYFTTNKITVRIDKTVKELEDTYTLQIYEKSDAQPPILCNLTVVEEKPTTVSVASKEDDKSWIAAPVIIVVLVIGLVLGVVVWFMRKRQIQRGATNANNSRQNQALLKESSNGSRPQDEHIRKRWFRQHFTSKDEEQLLHSNRTKPGSFLVTTGRTIPAHFLLIVFFDGSLKRFPISQENGNLKFLDTALSFPTLTGLVNHYKEHAIRYGDRDLGVLSKPFRLEPEDDWYFGKFTRDDEKKLLKTAGGQSGCFLIRDGETEPDDYVLAVCFNGEMKHFSIIEEEDGFEFRDLERTFHTLPELVQYYQNNDISVGNTNCGRLGQHFKKEQIDSWYLQPFGQTDDHKILKSPRKVPGSFLVAKGTTNPKDYILAVYFRGAVQRFTVGREGSRYKLLDTGMSFRTLLELINYYKEHDITTGTTVWGKLSTVLRLEPDEEWFFGKFSRDEEQKLLMSQTHGLGSFLIRERVSDPGSYVLAVFADGRINHLVINQEENGFVLRDVEREVYPRLNDLVAYYKENTIRVKGKEYCTLVKPFQK